ncbi:MAG: molecular chaperone HtpG [Ruminococcaceae bacterium]|nr:molecular chaperone HtpG [Oscillospiraceae bacterium]
MKKGGISVDTEHIFPVIKRWLYSDKEIFLRELVSNGCDAVTKMKRLVSLGKAENEEEYRIDVILDKQLSEMRIIDNGIGMTAEEIDRYINQIALSGALEFIEKYEGEEADSGIIGHFGLGFYSAFMVAKTVDINTLSFEKDASAAFWSCSDGGEYEMKKGSRTSRGTEICLHITEDEKEFLEENKVRAILEKYCAFMPVPIYLSVVGEKGDEECINDPSPLWLKNPSECTEEEYKAFYKKVFRDERDPLFYIHINAEFPLNFKGILYFPKLQDEYASLEGQVKLYYNQVFVADNIKEVIPEYMMLLRGVLDCPELPLNVSRSYLQNSGYVAKISSHITKKICDKLGGLFNNDRKALEGFWDDVKPFVEYGCTRDPKFFERVKNIILYKTTDGEYLTAPEYLEKNAGKGEENTMYYASDVLQQVGYIGLFREQGITVTVMDGIIDSRFLSFMEMQDKAVHFVRIDSELDKVLRAEEEAEEDEALLSVFRGVIPEQISLKQEVMKSTKTPALITLAEEKRRLAEILRQYGNTIPGLSAPEDEVTLSLNMNCPLIARIASLAKEEKSVEKAKALAKQVYMIAVISQRAFTQEELQEFIDSSIELLYNA